MRDIITRDIGWKLFSLLLAGIIWYPIWRSLEGGGTETSRSPFASTEMQSQLFTNMNVTVMSASADVHEFSVKPDTVNVKISGSPEDMSALRRNDIRAIVDLTDIEEKRDQRRSVNVLVPLGIKVVVRVIPAEVEIITPKPKESEPRS